MRRYSRSMIVIHWTTAVLVLAAWLTAAGGPQVKSSPPILHFTLGLAVLLLVVPRLIARALGGAPESGAVASGPMALAAKAGHALLYVFLVALPLSGWYAASRLGVPVSFLGIPIPALTDAVEGPPGLIAELHENAGTVILILAGLHGLMAIWHQLVLRDGTLARMLPQRAAR